MSFNCFAAVTPPFPGCTASGDKRQINSILKAKTDLYADMFPFCLCMLDCDDELEHTLSCALVVSLAWQWKSNAVIQV